MLPFPLSAAHTVRINYRWTGYSPFSPLEMRCVLTRQEEDWQGSAAFAVGEGSRQRMDVRVAVPVGVMRRFVDLLASVPLISGEYRPTFTHTDDYPEIQDLRS